MKKNIFLLIYVLCLTITIYSQTPETPEKSDISGAVRGFIRITNHEALPWKDYEINGIKTGIKAKTLSHDTNSGASSLLLYFPPGWSNPNNSYHNANKEIFLLAGELTVGEYYLTERCYLFVPSGTAQGIVQTQKGCTALVFFDKKPDEHKVNEAISNPNSTRAISFKNYFKEPWALSPTYFKWKIPPPLFIKVLREDENTGSKTYIVGVLSGHPNIVWEANNTWKEAYLLEGKFHYSECTNGLSDKGIYEPGGYFFRPSGQLHIAADGGPQGYAIFLYRQPAKSALQMLDNNACK